MSISTMRRAIATLRPKQCPQVSTGLLLCAMLASCRPAGLTDTTVNAEAAAKRTENSDRTTTALVTDQHSGSDSHAASHAALTDYPVDDIAQSSDNYIATPLNSAALDRIEAALNPAEILIRDQSFAVQLPTLGKVNFVALRLSNQDDNDRLGLYWQQPNGELSPLFISDRWHFFELKAVAFEAVDSDGQMPDVIVVADYITGIGPTGAEPFTVTTVHFNQGDDTFASDLAFDDWLAEQGAATVEAVRNLVHDADRSASPEANRLENRVVGLEDGMSYADVRSRLIDQGWIPHTFATTGPTPNTQAFHKLAEIIDLGFPEVTKCTSPKKGKQGRKSCTFDFVHRFRTQENGPILTVMAQGVDTEGGEQLLFRDWNLRNIAQTTYAQQNFSAAVFAKVQEEEGFCRYFGCDTMQASQHAFKDSLLLSAAKSNRTKLSLIPKLPMSRESAIAYSTILSDDVGIDFTDRSFREAALPYEGTVESYYPPLLADGSTPHTGFVVEFLVTPGGSVTEISFTRALL
ncbi:MAG: hypothetical protein AAFV90_15995 [Cyanobacteria bacterium J06634_5]